MWDYKRLLFLIGTLEIVRYINLPEVAIILQSVEVVATSAGMLGSIFDRAGCGNFALLIVRHPFGLVLASTDTRQKDFTTFAPVERAAHGFIIPFLLALHGYSVF